MTGLASRTIEHPVRAHADGAPSELDSILAALDGGLGERLGTATGLPPAAYVSQSFFDLEVEKVFRREWLCVGHVSQLPSVGDYFTTDLFGESLVVVRGPDRIRALSRICLHRWAFVASGRGNAQSFTCPFHNWNYALDGRLTAPTYMQRAENFDLANCRLPEIRSEIVEELGLIFVTFAAEIDSISARLADLCQRLSNYRLKDLVSTQYSEVEDPFNWKFKIETGMEAYHHFGTHRTTLGPAYPTQLSWCEDSKHGWTVCHSPANPAMNLVDLPAFPDITPEETPGLDLYHVYPLLRMGVYPDRIRIQPIVPLSADRTRSCKFYLLRPEVAAQTELVARNLSSTPETIREDVAINRMQQAAAHSRLARGGRLSHLEATVWHLAQYLREKLAAA